jgi:hypothetical protein
MATIEPLSYTIQIRSEGPFWKRDNTILLSNISRMGLLKSYFREVMAPLLFTLMMIPGLLAQILNYE